MSTSTAPDELLPEDEVATLTPDARYEVLESAMAKASNRDDVVRFLTDPAQASVLRSMQDAEPWEIVLRVHRISDDLRYGSRDRERVPRAPEPPVQVGGRGVSPDDPIDAALERRDYKTVKALWDRQALRGKR
jgi:hypothetical protein